MYEDFPFDGYYAFICKDSEGSAEKRKTVRAEHVARLKQLQEEQRLMVAGPLLDNDDLGKPAGGLMIAKFDSLQAAEDWIKEEPYLKVGAYQHVQVKAFKPIFTEKK